MEEAKTKVTGTVEPEDRSLRSESELPAASPVDTAFLPVVREPATTLDLDQASRVGQQEHLLREQEGLTTSATARTGWDCQ